MSLPFSVLLAEGGFVNSGADRHKAAVAFRVLSLPEYLHDSHQRADTAPGFGNGRDSCTPDVGWLRQRAVA